MDPDIIDALLAHLQQQIPTAPTIEEAWFAEALDQFEEQTPAILPYLAEERPYGEPETLRPVQRVRLVYGVWLVCPREQFREMRQALQQALFGHQFSEQHNPAAYMGGKTEQIVGQYIWWREFWAIDTHRRGQPQ